MNTREIAPAFETLFSELTNGAAKGGGAYVLNSGDIGLIRSLEKLTATDASHSANGGATVAAHAQHVRYGLSLMNRWAAEGGDPFANAQWDVAWKTSIVNESEWKEIRTGLGDEARTWLMHLRSPRDVNAIELNGLIGSIAHLAYHLGAIRQIEKATRGPKEGTFATP
jgi:hypothetical protein